MKIDRIETFLVPPRWLFLRVETDDGVVGWGEPVVEGSAEPVRAAVDQFAEFLIGRDPSRIEDIWQTLTRGTFYRGGPVFSSAVAGIDQALWDIAGKALGVPVHTLLGGHVRDRVRVYGWVGGDDPSSVREAVQERVEWGLTAVKMNASGRMEKLASARELDGVLERVASAKEVLGPDRGVALDFHGRVTNANARRLMVELEPLGPLFVEEPVVPENAHLLQRLVETSSIPVATGERMYSRQEFLRVLESGVAIVQPDLSHAGGISEVRRIAALAETFDALVAPHCPLGPIALAASLQIGFSAPNHFIQEQSIGIHYNETGEVLDYIVDTSVFDYSTGFIERPLKAGLGVEIDEAAVRAAAEQGHRWRSPVWHYSDGSVAEW